MESNNSNVQYTIEPTLTYNDIADSSNNLDEDSIQMKTQPTPMADSLGIVVFHMNILYRSLIQRVTTS